MIDSHKFACVLEYHDLVLCVPRLGSFPLVDGYLDGLGAVVAGYAKYAASWHKLATTQALLAHAGRAVEVWIRGRWAGAEPGVARARRTRKGIDKEGHGGMVPAAVVRCANGEQPGSEAD